MPTRPSNSSFVAPNQVPGVNYSQFVQQQQKWSPSGSRSTFDANECAPINTQNPVQQRQRFDYQNEQSAASSTVYPPAATPMGLGVGMQNTQQMVMLRIVLDFLNLATYNFRQHNVLDIRRNK